MSKRIVKSDVDSVLHTLHMLTNNADFSYDIAYGKYKLVTASGSVEVSPRLSKREIYDWMNAYIKGITDYNRVMVGWNNAEVA